MLEIFLKHMEACPFVNILEQPHSPSVRAKPDIVLGVVQYRIDMA